MWYLPRSLAPQEQNVSKGTLVNATLMGDF